MASKAQDRGLTPEEIQRETKKLAADLAFCARAPVSIQLATGQHLAFTYGTDEKLKQHMIPVVMNPDLLKPVRNKKQAIKIWRGIGFHELAHHLWPAETFYKKAHELGFRDLFNLIDDEQNERRGRAMNPEWGQCFQALCAFIFDTKKKQRDGSEINLGIIDGGKKGEKPWGMAATKIYAQRWDQFKIHLRRHVPNPVDPVVARAFALIQPNFKDISKEELFEVTKAVHGILCTGIEMPDMPPPPPPEEPKEEPKKKEPEPEEPSKDDKKEEENEEPAPEDPGWRASRLLRSRWMIIPFVLFVAGWVALLLRGGISFWVQVAFLCVCAGGGIITFLFIRRAAIKAFLARLKPARAPTSSKPDAPGPIARLLGLLSTKKAKWVIGTAVIALIGGLFYKLFLMFGTLVAMLCAQVLLIVVMFWVMNKFGGKFDRQPTATSGGGTAPEGKSRLGLILGLLLIPILASVTFTLSRLGLQGLWLIMLIAFVWLVGLGALLIFALNRMKPADPADNLKYRKLGTFGRAKMILREKMSNLSDGVIYAIGAVFRGTWRAIVWASRLFGKFVATIAIAVWRFIVRFIWRPIVSTWRFLWKHTVRIAWAMKPRLTRLWRHAMFRLAVITLPVATILVMLYAVSLTAAKTSPWLLVALIILLLLLLLLGFLYRKKLRNFIVNELFMPMPELMMSSAPVPLDMDTEWFVQIDNIVPVQSDQATLDALAPIVDALAEQLRPILRMCGRHHVDREDQCDGYDLGEEPELALTGEMSVFVDDDVVPRSSLHIELALDCSGSMSSQTASLKAGDKFKLGKIFALAIEKAITDLPGVSGHFWGFTNNAIFDCGMPGEGGISGLQVGGGNNDAAMLWHMGQEAARSGKDVKILLMLSDGQPSDCSWLSLHNLVLQFEQEGMIPWNFGLDEITVPAFNRYFTDLVGQTMEEAIATMGDTMTAIAMDV